MTKLGHMAVIGTTRKHAAQREGEVHPHAVQLNHKCFTKRRKFKAKFHCLIPKLHVLISYIKISFLARSSVFYFGQSSVPHLFAVIFVHTRSRISP